MPDDIAHLIVDACIMTVCDCCKDTGIKNWTTFNTEFTHYRYTVMPFGVTVVGMFFSTSWTMFGHIPNESVIADDTMVVGRMQNHRGHDQALTTLLHTARKCKCWIEL